MKGKGGTWQVGEELESEGTPFITPHHDPLRLAQAMLRDPSGGKQSPEGSGSDGSGARKTAAAPLMEPG